MLLKVLGMCMLKKRACGEKVWLPGQFDDFFLVRIGSETEYCLSLLKMLLHCPYNVEKTKSFDQVLCWDVYIISK